MSLKQALSMYMKRFSLRSALFSRMDTNTDTLRKMMEVARKMLKRNINTLPKLVRGITGDKPRLLLLIGAEKTCVQQSVQFMALAATQRRGWRVTSALIYVGDTVKLTAKPP